MKSFIDCLDLPGNRGMEYDPVELGKFDRQLRFLSCRISYDEKAASELGFECQAEALHGLRDFLEEYFIIPIIGSSNNITIDELAESMLLPFEDYNDHGNYERFQELMCGHEDVAIIIGDGSLESLEQFSNARLDHAGYEGTYFFQLTRAAEQVECEALLPKFGAILVEYSEAFFFLASEYIDHMAFL